MICYHHDDLDGNCAAALVLREFPDCKMRSINYRDDPDFRAEVNHGERVFIVDYSFKPRKLQRLFVITQPSQVVWIDHHETAEDYKYTTPYSDNVLNLRGLRDFSQECKKSGAELTWEYFHQFETHHCGNELMPEAVRLIGDYDCWRFDTERKTNLFQQGMKLDNTDPKSKIWKKLLRGSQALCSSEPAEREINQIIYSGEMATKYRDSFCKNFRDSFGWFLTWEGYTCYAMNLYTVGSQGFGDLIDEVDVLISFVFTEDKWQISLYSEHIHVGKLAKKYGGGGHKGAAGFVCTHLPF